jgi:hypothetical protein
LRDLEKRIMLSMVASHTSDDVQRRGGMYRSNFRGGITVMSLANQMNVPLTQVAEFFASTRKHVKEGMIPASPHAQIAMGGLSENTVSILLGMPVKPSQFLSIESPTLAEVVSEEPGFEQTAAGKAAKLGQPVQDPDDDGMQPPKLTKNPSYLDGLRSQNDFKEETLYMILKKEESREKEEWQANMKKHVGQGKQDIPMPPGVDLDSFIPDDAGLRVCVRFSAAASTR